jgi:hypothetical protein
MGEAADVFALVIDALDRRTGPRVLIGFESPGAAAAYAARHRVRSRPAVIDFDTGDPRSSGAGGPDRPASGAGSGAGDDSGDEAPAFAAATAAAGLPRRGGSHADMLAEMARIWGVPIIGFPRGGRQSAGQNGAGRRGSGRAEPSGPASREDPRPSL